MKILKQATLILSVLSLVSCKVTPTINDRSTPAFDGSEPDGGIIQDFEDYSSEITPHARDRYNNLILAREGLAEYISKKDYGITNMGNGNFKITAEGKEYWYELKLEEENVSK